MEGSTGVGEGTLGWRVALEWVRVHWGGRHRVDDSGVVALGGMGVDEEGTEVEGSMGVD